MLRVGASAGLSASALGTYCLATGLLAAAVTALAKRRLWLDWPRLGLLVVALWSLPSVYGRVGGDGVEYYVQARSILFDRDLDFANDYLALHAPAIVTAAGEVTSRMPVGVPLLWIPALALTHCGTSLASWFGVDIATDGASPVYQTAATTATFLYGFLALVLMESALRARYGRALAMLVTAGIWLATPLHFYMVANPFMSHGASVFAVTLFVTSWLRARESDSLRPWIFAGAWAGMMMLVRVQDALLLLVPLMDIAFSTKPRLVARTGALLVGPAACGLIQASIWMSFYGIGFAHTVLAHGAIAATSPQVVGLLFSPRHGLLSWTPIFIASLFGWGLLARRSKRVAAGIWLAFAGAVFFNSSNTDWWGSDSFGQRRMLGMLPFFAWGLAETMEALWRRPLVLLTTLVVALSVWNLQFGYIYNSMMLGTRNDALTLDRVVEAQVDVSYRRILAWRHWMPAAIWVVIYDNVKGVWLDEGARSFKGVIDLGNEPPGFSPLVGDGWFEPETEDTTFRRSQTRRSWLFVPIREPKDYKLVLNARGEVEGHVVKVRLDVNGNAVGEVELVAGWSHYDFQVPEAALHPGLNALTFVYSATPRMLIPGFRGRNTVMAVDWLRFVPLPARQ